MATPATKAARVEADDEQPSLADQPPEILNLIAESLRAEEDVLQPLLVSTSALSLATECVRMILKIDDICPVR